MKLHVTVLGAGFGGLELSTLLSEALGDQLELTLIDQNDAFFFGFSKLDVLFGKKPAGAVKIPYQTIVKPGVIFRNSDWLGAQCAATLRIFASRIPARSTARPTDLGIDFGTEV